MNDGKGSPAGYRWQTMPDGWVRVEGEKAWLDKLPEKVMRWRVLAEPVARKARVPLAWVLGTIYAESGGDPDAVSPSGAIGLMQIVPKWHPWAGTAVELRDPATNIRAGAQLLGASAAAGFDLPESASRYNEGAQPNGKPWPGPGPWGMREQGSYIMNVVKGSNATMLDIDGSGLPAAAALFGPPATGVASLVAGAVAALAAAGAAIAVERWT